MNGKIALITGASSGIGKATAQLFAEKGVKMVLASRREQELESLAHQIEALGGMATAIKMDVAIEDDVAQAVQQAMRIHGRLDFAINSAGIEGELAGITDMTEEAWDSVLNVNLKGIFFCIKHQAKAMQVRRRGGVIVNVGSINSFLGFPFGSAYVASKHGLVGLTSSASAELAPQGIRVNLLCPGFVDTPMHQRARQTLGDEIYANNLIPRVHLQRLGQPEEIAKVILFLCSDDASFMTGTTITPDGGFTLTV
jgi:NAD(P)-dependent dehydrogenase (short-subunit alcohol dehydrogenase family)